MLGFFLAAQFLIGKFFGPQQQGAAVSGGSLVPSFADRPDMSTITNATAIPSFIAPVWEETSPLDISIYVSPSRALPPLSAIPEESKVLEEKSFAVGNFDDSREISKTLRIPPQIQNNGTLWAHFFVALAGHELDPMAKGYSTESAYYFARPLTQYLPKKKVAKLKNLLESASDDSEPVVSQPPKKVEIGSFYHPNVTISIIPNTGIQNFRAMHPASRQYVQLERTGARDASGQNGWYYPTVFVNTFWQLRSHMTELNSTVETLPLHITLNNLANWKFSMMASMDEGMKQTQRQATSGGPMPAGGDGSELELFKEILLNSNTYLLATTGIVSVLHMIFEGLAFKNDIVSPNLQGEKKCISLGAPTYHFLGTLAEEKGQCRNFPPFHPW